jgi:predicted DNA binding protein
MDRMLLSFPVASVEEYNDSELDYQTIKWYSETIKKFYEGMKTMLNRNDEQDIEPLVLSFSKDAKVEWKRIFNKITSSQNNEDENEYLKSMYPKQKSYIPRFALLLNAFHSFFDDKYLANEIHLDSILMAEKLSDYFVMTAKKIKIESTETQELKTTIKNAETTLDKLKVIYSKDKDFNRSKVAEMLGVSRMTVSRHLKELENATA